MTDNETRVLHGLRQRAALGRSAAKADYLAMLFGMTTAEVRAALMVLERQGKVRSTRTNSFTPEWHLTTEGSV